MKNRYVKNMIKKVTLADLISSGSNQSKKWDWDWYILFLTWFFKSNENTNLNQKFQYLNHLLQKNAQFREIFISKWVLFIERVKYDSLWVYTFSGESDSFIQELLWALNQKIFSVPPQGNEISYLIDELLQLDLSLKEVDYFEFKDFQQILSYLPQSSIEHAREEIKASLVRSIYILSNKNISDLFTPLFKMASNEKYQTDFIKMHDYVTLSKISDFQAIKDLNNRNIEAVDKTVSQFKESGVSLNALFKIKKIKSRLVRLENLIKIYENYEAHAIFAILAERKIFYSLQFQFFHYSSQLIEIVSLTSAETGDHYVGRNQSEIRQLFYKACGGGFLTAFTVLIKALTGYLHLAPFFMGFLYSLNYAVSFIVIYLLGFSLATKQPAAVAAHLTQKWQKASRSEILNEIGQIFKSQFWAVVGNVGVVVPTVLVVSFLSSLLFGQNFLTPEKAHYQIHSMSVLGFTPFYAFLTGYFLWFSTFISGVADNFFKVYQLDQVILGSRKLLPFIGQAKKRKIINFLKNNFGALCGNGILGFILGCVPLIGDFLGLPIDVRHVTLSSGMIAASIYTLGLDIFYDYHIYLAILGVIVTGILNLSVSFVISLQVAESANSFSAGETEKDSSKLLRLFLMKKLLFWRK
ncbi:MAG: hypothetical protein ACK41T_02415 [Pseudobdellovibrio sp.]